MRRKQDFLKLTTATIKRQYRELRKKDPALLKVNMNHQFDFNELSEKGVSWSTIKKAAQKMGIVAQTKDGDLIWIWPEGKEKRKHLRRKLREVIEVIHDYMNGQTQPSLHHDDPALDCSQETLREALEALAMEGVRLKGISYWLPPARKLKDAFKSLNDTNAKKRDEYLNKQFYKPKKLRDSAAQIALKDIMIDYKFDAPANAVIEDLEQFGYSRITAHRAKKRLKIASVKAGDGWHWVYPATTVQTWLENTLGDQPRVVETLYHAAQEREWSRFVVDVSRKEVGGIRETFLKGKRCWYNMNLCSPPFTETF